MWAVVRCSSSGRGAYRQRLAAEIRATLDLSAALRRRRPAAAADPFGGLHRTTCSKHGRQGATSGWTPLRETRNGGARPSRQETIGAAAAPRRRASLSPSGAAAAAVAQHLTAITCRPGGNSLKDAAPCGARGWASQIKGGKRHNRLTHLLKDIWSVWQRLWAPLSVRCSALTCSQGRKKNNAAAAGTATPLHLVVPSYPGS